MKFSFIDPNGGRPGPSEMGLLELEYELAAVREVRDEPVELTDEDAAEISDAARATRGWPRLVEVGMLLREGCELMEEDDEDGLNS